MRRARRYAPLILTCFMAGCATTPQDPGLSTDATVIDLPGAVHFRTPEDADQTVEAGPYRVERADPGGLRLKELDGSRALTIKAVAVAHDFELRGPLALTAPEGEDTRHIALLFPGGQALNAVGSVSGVQSRATAPTAMSRITMQQSVQVLTPTKLVQLTLPPPDACAGAIPPLPAPPAPVILKQKQFTGLTNPSGQPVIQQEFGPDPIPDVVDWQPKKNVPAGRELIIQGRNLDPTRFVAKIGEYALPVTTKSSSEIRFAVPASLRSFNTPLVVYHRGGTPRTLEPNYEVFDPVSRITRVAPETFSPGDIVTLCGVSVSHLTLTESVRTGTTNGVPQYATVNLALIGTPNGQYQNYHWIGLQNPVSSASGDRLTFVAGSLFKSVFRQADASGTGAYTDIVSDPAPPSPVIGPLSFHSETNPATSRDVLAPNPVTWRLGGPKIAAVGMHPNAQFGLSEPFLIQPTILPNNTLYAGYGVGRYFVVDGFNLQGQYRLGNVSIPQLSLLSNDYTKIGVSPPPTATGGQLCGTNNGITNCSPQSLTIIPGPVLATIPNAPLALRVTHTINGLHLLPSGTPGLTYELYVTGLMDPNLQIAGGSAPTIGQCNMTVQVLEHTDSRIQFRIGDPNGPAPSSSCMTFRADFFNAASPNRPTIFLVGKYNGKQLTMWHQPFHLSQ